MAIKFSEMCAVRTDLASSIEAAFDNSLEEIAQGYGDYLTPMLEEGETAPDVELQLVLLGRKVRHHRQQVDNLDEELLEEAQGDEQVRTEIDRRTDAVDAKLRQVRSAYRGFYGRDNLGRVGLEGDFPRGAVRLHRLAVTAKGSLTSPEHDAEPLLEVDLTEKEGETSTMAVQLGAQLDPEVTQLGELLDRRHRESSRTLDARLKRRDVIREFDFHIRGIVRMAQGMFRLAGRGDLAARIRPILQRVLRKLDDQKAKEEAEAGADADATPEDAEAQPEQTAETASSE